MSHGEDHYFRFLHEHQAILEHSKKRMKDTIRDSVRYPTSVFLRRHLQSPKCRFEVDDEPFSQSRRYGVVIERRLCRVLLGDVQDLSHELRAAFL